MPDGLPDFIIIGAAKSGTSSLHHILASHPEVYIPEAEVYFFDVDDIEVHPDFFRYRGQWVWHDFDADHAVYLQWYRGLFAAAAAGQKIGEDTTTYLASRRAPARIERLLPEVKLIAMLRDPVARAYSQYWHNVRAGRSSASFEQTLRRSPTDLIDRGRYREQLERYRGFLERGQLRVVLFEEFARDTAGCLAALSEFLGLSSPPDVRALDTHRNATHRPLSVPARLAFNAAFGNLLEKRRRIPNMPGFTPPPDAATAEAGLREDRRPSLQRAARVASAAWGRLPPRPLPAMKEDTRAFLERLFARENAGLSALIGRDVAAYWPYMRN